MRGYLGTLRRAERFCSFGGRSSFVTCGESGRRRSRVLTPSLASLRARIGANALHASRDSRETTAKARATFLARFEAEVDPDRVLPDAERLRRAEAAMRAHFSRLALKSAMMRRKKK